MAKIVQTADRDGLGDFAPQFAHFNDDVLFGEEWNNEDISLKARSIITISVFIGRGLADSSLLAHLKAGKANGISKTEIAAIITHAAFYAGWPVAWAAFNLAKQVWNDDRADQAEAEAGQGKADQDKPACDETTSLEDYAKTIFFPVGDTNDANAQYFEGQSYLAPVQAEGVPIANVTFEPGCINHWHVHHASQGGGQMLIAVGGRGYYQIEGQDPVAMLPGAWPSSPPTPNTGMGPPRIAGSLTWLSCVRERTWRTNGGSRWTGRLIFVCPKARLGGLAAQWSRVQLARASRSIRSFRTTGELSGL